MTPTILSLQNVDLLSVGVAVAGMFVLGFVVLFNNVKSITNRVFFYLAITAGVWGFMNYLSYQPYPVETSFGLLRLVMFLAVWCSYFTFTFAYIFPSDTFKFSKLYGWVLAPITTFTAIIALTPLVFVRVSEVTADGRILRVINGPGIFIFGATILILNLGTVISLIVKVDRARKAAQRKPLETVLFGVVLMLTLIVGFNFVLPAFFDTTKFIPLGAVFMFPFIAFTSYAIMKHKLFNVRVAGTAVLVFALSVVNFSEVILAREPILVIYRSAVYLLVLTFGILLIKGVLKEVEQREQLQILSDELQAANEQLKILDQARADFITIASHQLRTPPATIKWYLAAILDGDYGKFDDSVREQLRKTASTNNSMISLIDDLLNASRIERGKMEFIFGPTNIIEITQVTIEQLLPQAEMKKLNLVFEKPKEAYPVITADKEKLRQVINNLIDNAIKYTQQGNITVTLTKTKKDLILKVTDSGRGVAPDQLNHIFEKYDRGKSPARNSSGLGLGLFVAKVIVEQHKGKIWVESKGEGKGSSFIFSVPINTKLENTVFDLAKS